MTPRPSNRVAAAVEQLVAARRTRTQFDAPADTAPADADEAYAIQDEVARRVGPAAGTGVRAWKTGGPNALAPVAAPIPASSVFASPARLNGADYHVIGIEAELAYVLDRDLPPRTTPYVEIDVAAAVGAMQVAIEVCDSRLANWRTAVPMWKLADNQMNAALVVGEPLRDWRRIAPERQSAFVDVDGAPLAHATGSHPTIDPLRLLPWLANHCVARCGGLRAGDVVTTGAWTGMHFVRPGASVVARFPGIGEARVVFD